MKLRTVWHYDVYQHEPHYILKQIHKHQGGPFTGRTSHVRSQVPHFGLELKYSLSTLNGCWVMVKILTALLNEIEPGLASTSSRVRKWTALKAVLKHGQLMKFQAALERLKGKLLLAQQNGYR